MVEVFKTDVSSEQSAEVIITRLCKMYPGARINFDLEDCDKILRIACNSGEVDPGEIMDIVESFGFSIQLLE